MGRSIGIGTVRGVALKVHPSFALILLWVIYQWGVAAGAGLAGMLFGSLVLIAVFGCVLLHELAHAVVAMHYGLRVRDITLLPVGGVARVEHVAMTPKVETAIALAGPLMNLFLAALLSPIIFFVAAVRHIDHPVSMLLYANEISVVGFVLYLWVANVLLALFNLIPAFPMDGGRVLRALLTAVRDRQVATRLAVISGQVFAIALGVLGIWAGDFLMPLVSIFLVAAGQMEARHVRVERSLRALPIGQFALWEAGGIRPDAPLAHAAKDGPKDMAVTARGAVVGMLWRHDLLRHLNGAHHEMRVRDIMDRRFNAVEATDSVYDVHLWLLASNRPAVPVVENGVYRGVFSIERLAHVHDFIDQRSAFGPRGPLATLRTRLRLASR